MKCPILFNSYHHPGSGMDFKDTECSTVDCAWWSSRDQHCAVLDLVLELRLAVGALSMINDNLKGVGKR